MQGRVSKTRRHVAVTSDLLVIHATRRAYSLSTAQPYSVLRVDQFGLVNVEFDGKLSTGVFVDSLIWLSEHGVRQRADKRPTSAYVSHTSCPFVAFGASIFKLTVVLDTPGTTVLSYTPNGRRVVTGGSNSAIRIYTVGEDGEPKTVDGADGHLAIAATVRCSTYLL